MLNGLQNGYISTKRFEVIVAFETLRTTLSKRTFLAWSVDTIGAGKLKLAEVSVRLFKKIFDIKYQKPQHYTSEFWLALESFSSQISVMHKPKP